MEGTVPLSFSIVRKNSSGCGEQSFVISDDVLYRILDDKMLFYPLHSTFGHPSSLFGMVQHPGDGICKYDWVSRLDQQPRYTGNHNLYRAAFIGGDSAAVQPPCLRR